MGFLDAMKDRINTNLKFVRLSLMTQPGEIIQFCNTLTAAERSIVVKGIESSFKWHSMGQIAETLFPSYAHSGGVSAEAMDLVRGGYVDAGVELMRSESRAARMQAHYGMQPMQQAALSFAWVVLKAIEQRDATGTPGAFCSACGSQRRFATQFCANCGRRF